MIKERCAFLLSLGLHLFFLGIFIYFGAKTLSFQVPGKEEAAVQVYLASSGKNVSSAKPDKATQNLLHERLKQIVTHGLAMERASQAIAQSLSHPQTMPEHKAVEGKTLDPLITLIYQAVDRHKVYPSIAEDLDHAGKVLVTFTLAPTGEISEITLTQSSGYEELDQAALATVHNASPIFGVAQYLTTKESFSIPIVYET